MNTFLRFSVAALILYGVSSSFCGALHAADDVYAKDDKGRTQNFIEPPSKVILVS